MALRLMQIFVPKGSGEKSDKLLEGREVLGRWRDTQTDQTVLHLLVPVEETEPIMDEFEQAYSSTEGFHVVLFPVEAVLPRPQAKSDREEASQPDETERAKESQRISREELYNEVVEGLGVSRVFVGMTILAAVVAAIGLMRDDVVVIIGAMVMAPLLGPNVAMAFATTLGDIDLLRRGLVTNFVGVALTFLFSIAVGYFFYVDPEVPAIASRTQLAAGDILLALAAGTAGTLALTRGLSTAVIGVMVAVALVPPLVTAGLLFGAGQPTLGTRALLLTGANVICVNLAGIVTLLAQGVRPRNWWEAKRAKSATYKATIVWAILLILLVVILAVGRVGVTR